MNKKLLIVSIFCFSMGKLCADDMTVMVKVRKDPRPEVKLFLGNTILSTLIGASFMATGLAIDGIAEQLINGGRNNRFFALVEVPSAALAAAGTFTITGALLYNIIKLAQHWRTVGLEELEKIEKMRNSELQITV